LDPLIFGTIQMLNLKGYTTKFSCQGHPERAKPAYISFQGRFPKFPTLPPGFEKSKIGKHPVLIKWDIEHGTERSTNISLAKWASDLPQRKRLKTPASASSHPEARSPARIRKKGTNKKVRKIKTVPTAKNSFNRLARPMTEARLREIKAKRAERAEDVRQKVAYARVMKELEEERALRPKIDYYAEERAKLEQMRQQMATRTAIAESHDVITSANKKRKKQKEPVKKFVPGLLQSEVNKAKAEQVHAKSTGRIPASSVPAQEVSSKRKTTPRKRTPREEGAARAIKPTKPLPWKKVFKGMPERILTVTPEQIKLIKTNLLQGRVPKKHTIKFPVDQWQWTATRYMGKGPVRGVNPKYRGQPAEKKVRGKRVPANVIEEPSAPVSLPVKEPRKKVPKPKKSEDVPPTEPPEQPKKIRKKGKGDKPPKGKKPDAEVDEAQRLLAMGKKYSRWDRKIARTALNLYAKVYGTHGMLKPSEEPLVSIGKQVGAYQEVTITPAVTKKPVLKGRKYPIPQGPTGAPGVFGPRFTEEEVAMLKGAEVTYRKKKYPFELYWKTFDTVRSKIERFKVLVPIGREVGLGGRKLYAKMPGPVMYTGRFVSGKYLLSPGQAVEFFNTLKEAFTTTSKGPSYAPKFIPRTYLGPAPGAGEEQEKESRWLKGSEQPGANIYEKLIQNIPAIVTSNVLRQNMGLHDSMEWALRKRKMMEKGQIAPSVHGLGLKGVAGYDTALVWTGDLLNSIEAWGSWEERAVYYGVRSQKLHSVARTWIEWKGKTGEAKEVTVTDVAYFMEKWALSKGQKLLMNKSIVKDIKTKLVSEIKNFVDDTFSGFKTMYLRPADERLKMKYA